MSAKLFAALVLGAAIFAAAQESTPPQTNEIQISGCVQKGVEAGCLMLKDTQTGKLYQLLIRGQRPEAESAIEVTGAPFRGMTSCMQGQPVSVFKWSRSDARQCPETPQN